MTDIAQKSHHRVKFTLEPGERLIPEFTCTAPDTEVCRHDCAENLCEQMPCEHDRVNPDGKCLFVEWMAECDSDECYDGESTTPHAGDIDISWNGDYYTWDYAKAEQADWIKNPNLRTRITVLQAIYDSAATTSSASELRPRAVLLLKIIASDLQKCLEETRQVENANDTDFAREQREQCAALNRENEFFANWNPSWEQETGDE